MKKLSNQSSQKLKVYEYVDQDGNVFWSFTETKERVTITKLRLVDRVGMWYLRWEAELRRMVRKVETKSPDVEKKSPVRQINWGKGSQDK